METFAANKEVLLETASPDLPLTDVSPSTQACGPDKSAYTAIQASKDTADFPACSVVPRIHTAPPTTMAFMNSKKKKKKKKKKMMTMRKRSICRSERRQHVNSSGRLEKFCKRRNGLFKKARELSIVCNVEVAAIVFSPHRKVSQFASSSMSEILKRYRSFQAQMPTNKVHLHGVKRWKREAILVNSKLKDLQELKRFSKNMSSSISDLENSESMLTKALDAIRKKKMELIEVETQKIMRQGEILFEENMVLKEKLTEILSTKECISKWK